MTAEMAGLRRLVPALSPAQVLRMATRSGAVALGLRPRAGDLCLVRAEATPEATLDAFTAGRAPVVATFCGGRLAWQRKGELPGSVSHVEPPEL
jgi:cytosine/adenosine deaminase-related metal-dependent hydrolase